MAKIPGITFKEALEYTTHDNKDAVITVGTIKDGQVSWTVYGENGQELKPGSGDAVVVLSNLSPDYRIPATVIGLKLLTEISN